MLTDKEIKKAFAGISFSEEIMTMDAKKKAIAKALMRRACFLNIDITMAHILKDVGATDGLHGRPWTPALHWMYLQYHE